MNIKDQVQKIVLDFVAKDILFTALDITSEVKKSSPFARHREVREAVQNLFPDMQLSSYGRTSIDVFLEDGSKSEAMLYHPLCDSWDLDIKYPTSRRTRISVFPPPLPPPTNSLPQTPTFVISTTSVGTIIPFDPKELWLNLFGKDQLFPLK